MPYDGNEPANYDLYGPKPDKLWSAGAELWQESGMPNSWKLEWYQRVNDLLSTYRPDYIYTDYGNVPFRREVGWQLLANYYNRSIADHGGKLEAVFTGKGDTERVFTRDFESGCAGDIQTEPWQMDKCINSFYYFKDTQQRPYIKADRVVRLLMDVVSKNGNLLLSIPQKSDGTIDAEEQVILTDMAAWMKVNSEAVFATRPFKIFGEGPTVISDFRKPWNYTAADIRFTTKDNTLYATVLGKPQGQVVIAALRKGFVLADGVINSIQLLGYNGKLEWEQRGDGLTINLPTAANLNPIASVFKINGLNDLAYDGLIYPNLTGNFTLNVDVAKLHGKQLAVASSHTVKWQKADEWLSWKAKIKQPGTYEVSIVSSAAGGASPFEIEAGGEIMQATFPSTKTWEDVKTINLGRLTFRQAGAATIHFRPTDAKTWRPLNLASVVLTPVKN